MPFFSGYVSSLEGNPYQMAVTNRKKGGVLLDRDYNYSPVIPFEDRCLEPPKALRAKTPQEVCLGVVISHKIVLEN